MQKFVLVVLALLGIAISASAIAVQTASSSKATIQPLPYQRPITGGSAIRTMPGVGKVITQADIIRYVTKKGMPRTLSGSRVDYVISVDLLTSGQISNLLHGEQTGLPEAKKLWFVTLKGVFFFPGPSSAQSGKVRSLPACHIGYEVFDPDTGNLYMFGGLA
jgi:hypothetical protein